MAARRRLPIKRDAILFTVGVGIVVYQQATYRISIPLLIFAALVTLAPGTLQLLAPLVQAYLTGTGGPSPPPPPSSSPLSSPPISRGRDE